METMILRYEDLPDNLTVKELKEYLRVGWVRAYKIAEEIPCYRAGNRRLFPKERVREWTMRQSESRAEKRLRTVR
ncbi:MAG: hypothetical protein ACYCX4_15590 [Bacillota bacterium]